jgi:acetylornithine/succinyldiaminopimelate/putrescine aminotransferase
MATRPEAKELPPSGRYLDAFRQFVNPRKVDMLEALDLLHYYEEASGDHLITADGSEYVDLVAGFGAATLGHRPQSVIAALQAALVGGGPFTVPLGISGVAADLAGKLCALSEGKFAKVYFGTSGAEGIETAAKFARAATGRAELASFSGAFHGMISESLLLTGHDLWRSILPRVAHSTHCLPFGDLGALEKLLSSCKVAAVAVEVVQGIGGARPWPAGQLCEIGCLAKKFGTLVIVDEVLTGVGRAGAWFAYQTEPGLQPDMAVISKGLSGGVVPISAVLMTETVYNSVYRPDTPTIHGNTFEGHLLGATAGLAVVETIEKLDLLARVRRLGERLRSGLQELMDRDLGLLDIRGRGLLIAFKVAGLEHEQSADGAYHCWRMLLDNGLLTVNVAHDATYIKVTPAFTVEVASIDRFLETIEHILIHLNTLRQR